MKSFEFRVSGFELKALNPKLETRNSKLGMEYTQAEILQTIRMTEMEHLDVRTVTLGLSLRDCATDSLARTAERVRMKIEQVAARLVPTVDEIAAELGLRVANKRISITPASLVAGAAQT